MHSDKANTYNGTNCLQREDAEDAPLKIDDVRMYNAECYHATNCMQRKDASDIITEYQRIFHWSPQENDYLLDIGAGCGDITYDYILPIIPQNTHIVATDKSQEMLDYARLNYSHPRISYVKLDIESANDINEVLRKYGQFHHITSFFALHWVSDQYMLMENIFRLLQPGGEVFMTLLQNHPVYEHYADMSELFKWSTYRSDMKKSTTPYFRNENPEKEMRMRMKRAGFVDINVVLKKRLFQYDRQVFEDSMVAVTPFLDKVSQSLKQDYNKIFIDKIMTMDLPALHKSNKERNDGKTLIPYCMLVAHAKKPSAENSHA